MLRILRSCVLTALLFVTFAALADFHEFRIEQIFSNADGTVQFVVMHNIGGNGEGFWLGHTLTSSDGVSPTKVFPFPSNLPSQTTAGRRVLIATPGFAALGLVTPDYIIPNGFLPLTNGVVNYAGVDQVPPVQVPQMRYAALPTDGRAIDHGGNPIPNVATNFAGASASVQAAPATPGGPPVALVPEKGLWWNPAEDGTGYNFDIKHGVLVMSMFTYESSGHSEWYVASGPLTDNGTTFNSTLDNYRNGQCLSCAFTGKPTANVGAGGNISITFTSPTSAVVTLPGGRVSPIQPQVF